MPSLVGLGPSHDLGSAVMDKKCEALSPSTAGINAPHPPRVAWLQTHAGPDSKEPPCCVSVPPTPLPTSDVDVYFETSADDNEHARFQKAKEQLEIRHRHRMDRVSMRLHTPGGA